MSAMQFVNPIVEQRADPWVYLHSDGFYYFTASVPEYDRIELRRASSIQGLGAAAPKVIWRKRDSGPMSAHIWAPEIHYVDGAWYIYFAAARADALFDHRTYVLQSRSANPLEGEWTELGQLRTGWESFTLDATSFVHRGTQYLVWAQRDPAIPGNSNLYIAAMENPWTLRGQQTLISQPEYEWERVGFAVNEGPAVLNKHGRLWLTYSASATDHHYCMGLLTADEASDPLAASSWRKAAEPVFQSSEATGQYGPGHSCFTRTPDGGEDILVYHARNYKEIVGDPLFDPNRHTRAQPIRWRPDGTPDFGVPAPDGPAGAAAG
jgi:GH43 family beta-xylosidase